MGCSGWRFIFIIITISITISEEKEKHFFSTPPLENELTKTYNIVRVNNNLSLNPETLLKEENRKEEEPNERLSLWLQHQGRSPLSSLSYHTFNLLFNDIHLLRSEFNVLLIEYQKLIREREHLLLQIDFLKRESQSEGQQQSPHSILHIENELKIKLKQLEKERNDLDQLKLLLEEEKQLLNEKFSNFENQFEIFEIDQKRFQFQQEALLKEKEVSASEIKYLQSLKENLEEERRAFEVSFKESLQQEREHWERELQVSRNQWNAWIENCKADIEVERASLVTQKG